MPWAETVNGWTHMHTDFGLAYARARPRQAESIAERSMMEGLAATAQDAHAAKVRMDACRWMAGRIDPDRWSDKERAGHGTTVNVNIGGLNGNERALRARQILLDDLVELEAGPIVEHDPSEGRFS